MGGWGRQGGKVRRMRMMMAAAAVVLTSGIATTARADVEQAEPGAIGVRVSVTVDAPAKKVWATLVEPKTWWDKAHTWSGDAGNLSIEPKVGGCFCEKLPSNGGVRHLTVEHVDPTKLLRMRGALGPMADMAVEGVLTITIAEDDKSADKKHPQTTLTFLYRVSGGGQKGGLDKLAKPVDEVITAQVMRLARVSEGKPATAAATGDTKH